MCKPISLTCRENDTLQISLLLHLYLLKGVDLCASQHS